MKKMIEMMIIGMGVGAGAVVLYDQCKSGNLQKLANKAGKVLEDMK